MPESESMSTSAPKSFFSLLEEVYKYSTALAIFSTVACMVLIGQFTS